MWSIPGQRDWFWLLVPCACSLQHYHDYVTFCQKVGLSKMDHFDSVNRMSSDLTKKTDFLPVSKYIEAISRIQDATAKVWSH
jgi:hypothetical protein